LLSQEELREIDGILPKGSVSGPRYPSEMMKLINA
jgi:hypothetical protein